MADKSRKSIEGGFACVCFFVQGKRAVNVYLS